MFPERCYNGGDKHNFKIRTDSKEIDKRDSEGAQLIQVLYVCDVCKWCGTVVKRPKSDDTKES